MGTHAGSQGPEILVLSHDDHDHIRGAAGLIQTAAATLRELWVPVEWAILIRQIADTGQEHLLPDDGGTVSTGTLEEIIADQITTVVDADPLSGGLLSLARANLSSWDASDFGPEHGFTIAEPDELIGRWYGATDLEQIIRRVRFRARTLIAVLDTALRQDVRVRFFSIDLALASPGKEWETQGRPGTATLANAAEAPHWLAVRVPPGLPHTFALTRLTVQNRRALCTLLWGDRRAPDGGAVIWSDTDGRWLDHSSPRGLGQVISTLRASSAPHHASANPAHDRVWTELHRAPASLIMISAGGNKTQSYRSEYVNLQRRRCCTWCRPVSRTYQEVRASTGPAGAMQLHAACTGTH